MSHSNITHLLVKLTEKEDPAPIAAPIHSFLRFSSEISLGLDELELRWNHLCTKHSTRSIRSPVTASRAT